MVPYRPELWNLKPLPELRICECGPASGSVFVGQSDESVRPGKRIAYYRGMAAEALRLAQAANDDAQKASYLDIAARWNALATEMERDIGLEMANAARKDKSEPQSNGDRH